MQKLLPQQPISFLFILTLSVLVSASCHAEADVGQQAKVPVTPPPQQQQQQQQTVDKTDLKSDDLFLYENFNDEEQFNKHWIQSQDSKYAGKWKLEGPADGSSSTDKQLILPLKARHYGISSKLGKPFKFSDDSKKALIVQYEVEFREGLDCGGAYAKLIRDQAVGDLRKLTDKTPFSIMFGPDKCGSDAKLHFIVQYANPKTGTYEEKHWKKSKQVLPLSVFSDKSSHLFRLVLKPDNNFELFVDDSSVGTGNLLEDLEPEINPPKEIVDPNDVKPEDWDERPQIDDPEAKKPEDWNEDLPKMIDEPESNKPSGWLDDEPALIPDPDAKKPDDWEDMDGEWEAPLIANSKCASAPGCGEWKPKKIPNPDYKGPWKAPKIDNPNYKGKWAPRMIPNPEYFHDENPFASLDAIGAISYELWSMADNIAFDNVLITSSLIDADKVKVSTWDNKKPVPESKPLMENLAGIFKQNPYLTIVPAVLGLILIYVIFSMFRKTGNKSSEQESIVKKKKLDQSRPDDSITEQPDAEEAEQAKAERRIDEVDDDELTDEVEVEEADDEEEEEEADETEEEEPEDEDQEEKKPVKGKKK